MTPVTQTKVVVRNVAGDIVVNGNCYAAAIASMLDLPITEVPNVEVFFPFTDKDRFFWDTCMNKWLELKGYRIENAMEYRIFHPDIFEPEFKEGGIQFNIAEQRLKLKRDYYFVSGDSPRGVSHICIFQAGILIHDPHPSKDGILNHKIFQRLVKINEP